MTISVTVYRDDDAESPIGTAVLVLDRAIVFDPALAAALVPERAGLAEGGRTIQAQLTDTPLTVRISAGGSATEEVRHTDGILHLCGGPGVPALVAADLDAPSTATPTPLPGIPAALRDPLTGLWSRRDELPLARRRAGDVTTEETDGEDGLPDPTDPPPSEDFAVCVFFPSLWACT